MAPQIAESEALISEKTEQIENLEEQVEELEESREQVEFEKASVEKDSNVARGAISECYEIEELEKKLDCYDAVALTLGDELEGQDVVEEEDEQSWGAAVDQRLDLEEQLAGNSFLIIPHRPNYILLYSYNHKPNLVPTTPTQAPFDAYQKQQRTEAKFQISFKVQLARDYLPDRFALWFAYTQKSYWQVFNSELSRPFRENNYEPELMLVYRDTLSLFGYSSEHYMLGISHQSNGTSDPASRSWNRIYTAFLFNRGNLSIYVKPWYRIPESEQKDNNPDIHRYLGYAEYGIAYKRNEDLVSLLMYNNLKKRDNKTSVELSYSFPLTGRFKGFIQYVNGYGESLIDYNHRSHRIGLGVLLTDWY